MTKDIYEKLQPYEAQLTSASKTNYARFEHGEFDKVADIYFELYAVKLSKSEKSCGMCKLKALKKIAADYFAYQEWYNKRWKNKKESEGEPNSTEQNNAE